MDERQACIILNLVGGIGAARLRAATAAFGGASAIFGKSAAALANLPGFSPSLAAKVLDWQKGANFEEELELAARAGVQITTVADPEYPTALKEIHDPPICLYIRGRLPDGEQPAIAVVGSRRVTAYGRRMAEHLAASAAYAGWVVVSGLAYGVDAIAHQATLDAGGVTVAVLGGGLGRVHPQDHLALARAVAETGAVVSEFPMTFPPNRRSFPARNRVISGLSRGTLVVEAGTQSGSLITANFALEHGRLVFAVPGQADNPQARGCNALIKQGAKLVENFQDVAEEFEFLPGFTRALAAKPEEGNGADKGEPRDGGEPESEIGRQITAALKQGEASLDELLGKLQTPVGETLSRLMRLEMAGKIRKTPEGRYAIK